MQRLNVSLKKNNDNDLYYDDRSNNNKNDIAKNNFSYSVKTVSHRTNRQNIGTAEFVQVPIKKIVGNTNNKNINHNNNNNFLKNSSNYNKKKNQGSDSDYNSSDEENKKKQHPNINNYVEYIKKNMISKSNKEDKKKNDRFNTIDSESDSDSDEKINELVENEQYNESESDSEEEKKIRILEKHVKIDDEPATAEIISFKIFNKLEPIISDIKINKDNLGLKLIFNINNKSLKSPFYLLNYQIRREIFLGTIIKKNDDYELERTIEYNKLEFDNNFTIKFNIIDLHSQKVSLVQEIEINLANILDRSITKYIKKHIKNDRRESKYENRESKYENRESKYENRESKYENREMKNDKKVKYKEDFDNKKIKKKNEVVEDKPKILRVSKNFRY